LEKQFWDDRYAEEGFAYGTEANAFLQSLKASFKPGQRALLVCDGEGRNGVWLAQQGLEVVSLDYSQVGLDKAGALANERGVKLQTICSDIYQWDWPVADFDFVILIYAHFRESERARLHQAALNALKPGGQLILEAYTREQMNYESGGPRDLSMLYSEQMLQEDFSGAEITELKSLIATLNEGKYHVGDGAIVRIVATRL
jgi:SAM-dependent methyltransferase